MSDKITYVKCNAISLTPALGDVYVPEVVDLGLGLDEAAKILGAYLNLIAAVDATVGQMVRCGYSFDPEDTELKFSDDEQFAYVEMAVSCVGVAGFSKPTHTQFFNFSGMNLITTRNLAFIGYGYSVAYTQGVNGIIYYEKYRPNDKELIQLIAQRR